ncbi:Aste57867_6943 [Aphanomyces stellatus]|uniref:Aste57867_6943 protein n=1 Tax=Aphanomyces stellatus TaxID=120398 RepID=A0A485KG83_9STRA|nr:hypothetical protein As57867_006921 [Aphanomyces stellatus]VFT83895.1 Aste57867_6943 [Aphanomyces stellatus]
MFKTVVENTPQLLSTEERHNTHMRAAPAPSTQEDAKAFAESLSEEDLEYLKQVARKTCARVASASRMDQGGSVTWEPIGHKDGVDIYIGDVNETSKSKAVTVARKYLCGVTHVRATIDDIVHFFHSKTELQRAKASGAKASFNAFEREILNTKTLYKIRKRTSSSPRHCISLKWMRLGSTVNEMEDRDFVFLECQDSIFDEKVKRRGWVCSMHSVQLPGCPPLEGYVRGSMYRSGFVFRETETPNILEVVCIMDMDFKGNMPANMTNLVLKARVMIVGAIREHFNALQAELEQPEEPETAVPCPLCEDYLASNACSTCGQMVCMNCSQFVDDERSVCTMCVVHGKVDQLMAAQENDVDDDTQVSIMLPKEKGQSRAPPMQPTMAPLHEDDRSSSSSTLEQNNEDDIDLDGIPGAADMIGSVKVHAPGFFAGMWADTAATPRPATAAAAVSYVEPNGRDPLYSLAVQRLQLAASAEQEATRLAIVNLYYDRVSVRAT